MTSETENVALIPIMYDLEHIGSAFARDLGNHVLIIHQTPGEKTMYFIHGTRKWNVERSVKVSIDKISRSTPNEHETLIQCCFNVGPASATLAQH